MKTEDENHSLNTWMPLGLQTEGIMEFLRTNLNKSLEVTSFEEVAPLRGRTERNYEGEDMTDFQSGLPVVRKLRMADAACRGRISNHRMSVRVLAPG